MDMVLHRNGNHLRGVIQEHRLHKNAAVGTLVRSVLFDPMLRNASVRMAVTTASLQKWVAVRIVVGRLSTCND